MAKVGIADAIRNVDAMVRTATYTGIQNASDDIMSTARDTVRQWRNKPDFGDEFTVTKERIECLIKPRGNRRVTKIFGYVDKGTKGPYLIFPKVPGTKLAFRTGYSARTAPVARYNVGSGQSFGKWVKTEGVVHPGIEGRKFLETAMEKLIPSLEVFVQRAINEAVK